MITVGSFKQDVGGVKKAKEARLVVIADHGRPHLVLMVYDDFERLNGEHRNLVNALTMPGLSTVDIAPSRIEVEPREADLPGNVGWLRTDCGTAMVCDDKLIVSLAIR